MISKKRIPWSKKKWESGTRNKNVSSIRMMSMKNSRRKSLRRTNYLTGCTTASDASRTTTTITTMLRRTGSWKLRSINGCTKSVSWRSYWPPGMRSSRRSIVPSTCGPPSERRKKSSAWCPAWEAIPSRRWTKEISSTRTKMKNQLIWSLRRLASSSLIQRTTGTCSGTTSPR